MPHKVNLHTVLIEVMGTTYKSHITYPSVSLAPTSVESKTKSFKRYHECADWKITQEEHMALCKTLLPH